MTKYLIAAAAIAAALFTINPSSAQADTKVKVYLGFGGPHAVHYRPHRGHWHKRHRKYHRHYRHHRPYYRPARRYTLPRWRVVRRMNHRGYYDCHNIRRRGDVFKMRCFRRGKLFKVRVSAWNGHVIRRHRLY